MDQKKTGELLSRLRKERGMTQREVAERLQISDRTVSKWERMPLLFFPMRWRRI